MLRADARAARPRGDTAATVTLGSHLIRGSHITAHPKCLAQSRTGAPYGNLLRVRPASVCEHTLTTLNGLQNQALPCSCRPTSIPVVCVVQRSGNGWAGLVLVWWFKSMPQQARFLRKTTLCVCCHVLGRCWHVLGRCCLACVSSPWRLGRGWHSQRRRMALRFRAATGAVGVAVHCMRRLLHGGAGGMPKAYYLALRPLHRLALCKLRLELSATGAHLRELALLLHERLLQRYTRMPIGHRRRDGGLA